LQIPPQIETILKITIRDTYIPFATISSEGQPHIRPFRMAKLLEDRRTIILPAFRGGKTANNLKNNPKAAILIIDKDEMTGYNLEGHAEYINDEHSPYITLAKKLMPEYPIKAAFKLRVENIYNATPGHHAGKRVTKQ
jgi:predicted pyridoxine 5'-phosphate oxidase superfamily flavin-nucleotide-binding protein